MPNLFESDTKCHLPVLLAAVTPIYHQVGSSSSSSFPSDMDLNLYLSLRMAQNPNETK